MPEMLKVFSEALNPHRVKALRGLFVAALKKHTDACDVFPDIKHGFEQGIEDVVRKGHMYF